MNMKRKQKIMMFIAALTFSEAAFLRSFSYAETRPPLETAIMPVPCWQQRPDLVPCSYTVTCRTSSIVVDTYCYVWENKCDGSSQLQRREEFSETLCLEHGGWDDETAIGDPEIISPVRPSGPVPLPGRLIEAADRAAGR